MLVISPIAFSQLNPHSGWRFNPPFGLVIVVSLYVGVCIRLPDIHVHMPTSIQPGQNIAKLTLNHLQTSKLPLPCVIIIEYPDIARHMYVYIYNI